MPLLVDCFPPSPEAMSTHLVDFYLTDQGPREGSLRQHVFLQFPLHSAGT